MTTAKCPVLIQNYVQTGLDEHHMPKDGPALLELIVRCIGEDPMDTSVDDNASTRRAWDMRRVERCTREISLGIDDRIDLSVNDTRILLLTILQKIDIVIDTGREAVVAGAKDLPILDNDRADFRRRVL